MVDVGDVAVVGAGILGLCTAYGLAERGARVDVYEHGKPGNGQSGGQSRIFRHAHDDVRLVEAAIRSRTTYDRWGERLGVKLVSEDGAVAIGPAVETRLPLLQSAGVPARRIGAAELAEQIPLLVAYDGPAMLDERGGSIHTMAAVAALVDALADRLIADEVITLRPTNDGVELRSGGRTSHYRSVVVCAGRDTVRLAATVGLSLPVRSSAHVRMTFPVRRAPLPRLATLQDSSGDFGETGVYAAPTPDNAAYAVGLSQTTDAREDGSLLEPGQLHDLARRASDYVRRALPGLSPDPVEVRHCWVTQLPWGEDALAVWQHEGLLFPAGHNLFKQAPDLGCQLADAALGEPLAAHLRPHSRLGAT